LALFAEANRPLSGVTLAVGAGIFVQGVAAYSFSPGRKHVGGGAARGCAPNPDTTHNEPPPPPNWHSVFLGGDCFDTATAAELTCRFQSRSAEGFSLRICPAAGAAPAHICT
jgi:hypothetical protein